MSEPQTCKLCGLEDHSVKVGLVEWQEPVEDQRFSALPRCSDRASCRARIEAAGDRWEVADRTVTA